MPSSEDNATLKAIYEGVDEAARLMEAKWGAGRLPLLVDVELRAKFHRQGAKFSKLLGEAWDVVMLTRSQLDALQSAAGGMERAWMALDAAAVAAGHEPKDPEVWEAVLSDGSIACIVQTTADASKVIKDGRHLNVWSLEEVARAIDAMPEAVRATKLAFPGAMVAAVKERSRGKTLLDDPIPF